MDNFYRRIRWSFQLHRILTWRWLYFLILLILIFGCASVPPQIAQIHQKELEIIQSLQKSHLAMVNAYVDQKISIFEAFYFDCYGPVYLKNWKRIFKEVNRKETLCICT